MALSVCVSCNNQNINDNQDDDTSDTEPKYTIIVNDELGKPVANVEVQICRDSFGCILPKRTGSDGAVTFEVEEFAYSVYILSVPDGYIPVDDALSFPENSNTLNIVLKLK